MMFLLFVKRDYSLNRYITLSLAGLYLCTLTCFAKTPSLSGLCVRGLLPLASGASCSSWFRMLLLWEGEHTVRLSR